MRMRVVWCVSAVAWVAVGALVASRTTDQAINKGRALTGLTAIYYSPGRMIPKGQIVAAGSVVGWSANLSESASAEERRASARNGKLQCWVRVKVAVPIAGTSVGDEITMHFVQYAEPAEGVMPWTSGELLERVRFTGGEKLLVTARRDGNRYRPVADLLPLADYNSPVVAALKELARWDGMTGQAKLSAMARAATSSQNPLLRYWAVQAVAGSTSPSLGGGRDWAFGVLSQIARNRAAPGDSELRLKAVVDMARLYDVTEKGGMSAKILVMHEELLNDGSFDRGQKRRILSALEFRGYNPEATTGRGKRGVFRQQALDIVNRFLAKTSDPTLKRDAQQVRQKLSRAKAKSRAVIPG